MSQQFVFPLVDIVEICHMTVIGKVTSVLLVASREPCHKV